MNGNGEIVVNNAADWNLRWYLDGDTLSGPNTSAEKFKPTQSGSYKLEFYKNGCNSFSDPFTVEATGIEEQSGNYGISIYPNPAQEMVRVNLGDHFSQHNTTILLRDMRGKTLLERSVDNGQQTLELDISEFAKGIYMIQLRNQEDVATKRLSIQ